MYFKITKKSNYELKKQIRKKLNPLFILFCQDMLSFPKTEMIDLVLCTKHGGHVINSNMGGAYY